jgi:hypothetical protein
MKRGGGGHACERRPLRGRASDSQFSRPAAATATATTTTSTRTDAGPTPSPVVCERKWTQTWTRTSPTGPLASPLFMSSLIPPVAIAWPPRPMPVRQSASESGSGAHAAAPAEQIDAQQIKLRRASDESARPPAFDCRPAGTGMPAATDTCVTSASRARFARRTFRRVRPAGLRVCGLSAGGVVRWPHRRHDDDDTRAVHMRKPAGHQRDHLI